MNDAVNNNELKEIQKKLKQAEKDDYRYLTEEVKKLRQSTFYLHTSTEASLDRVILDHFRAKAGIDIQKPHQRINFAHNVRLLLNEITFTKKLKIIDDLGLLPRKVRSKIYTLNQIRVYFSHPVSYRNKLLSYQCPENLLTAYRQLNEVLLAFEKAGIDHRPGSIYRKLERTCEKIS